MASQHMTKAAPPLTPTFLVLTFPAPRIVLIRMNRPAALNAMSTAAQWEMDAIWKWFDDEPTLSVAIITGTGRAFSAGADLKDWNNSMDSNADPSKRMGNTPAFTPLSRRLGKKPVIAAVNGLAMGGGCEFVVNCDLVIAAEEAVFGLPEVKRGIAAIGGALPRLIRTIGLQRASEFALTGRNVTAREMEAWGIVNKVVSRESLIEEAGFCLSAISAYIFLILPTNVLTYINADIGPSPYISWVNIARTLGLSFCYTILGRLSDLFGRRWFFIGGNCVALIGIIVCAAAPNVNSLIIGAAIYGVGETVQLSFNVAIGELVPNKYRPMVLSFVFLTNAPIATFGPIIDLGIFLWTAGLTLLLMGVSWGGNMYPWKSAATISSLIIGASLLVALFFWEGYADLKYPAIPIKFFLNRGWFSLVICATVASMFYYSAVLLWPQQVQALYTRDITYAGWLSTTVASSTALGQIVAGAIVKWGGNVRYWIIFSTFAMVGFVGALASLTPETKNTGIALTIIGPFFVGFIELAALALAPLYCITDSIQEAVRSVLPVAYSQAFKTVYLASLGFGGIAIAMRDRNKWAIHNLTEQVAMLTRAVEERSQQTAMLHARVATLEVENSQLRTQNAALQLSLMGRDASTTPSSGLLITSREPWETAPKNAQSTCLADEILQGFIASVRTDNFLSATSMVERAAAYSLKPKLCSLIEPDRSTEDDISNVVADIVRSYPEIETLPKQVAVFWNMALLLKVG
ncbi:hypothetical protein ACHAP0_007412 [Verticillium nonalfalfae]